MATGAFATHNGTVIVKSNVCMYRCILEARWHAEYALCQWCTTRCLCHMPIMKVRLWSCANFREARHCEESTYWMCLHTFHCLSLNKNQTLLRKGVLCLTWDDLLLLETSQPKATALLSIAKADFNFCVVFWRSKEKENNLLRVCSLLNAQIEYLAGISFEDLLRQTCCPLGSRPKFQRFSPCGSIRSQPTFRLLSFLWDCRGELEKKYTWMKNSRKKREAVRDIIVRCRDREPLAWI